MDDIYDWIAKEFDRQISEWEREIWEWVIYGNGTGEPRGILNDEHRGVEWSQARRDTDDRSVAVSRAIHRWSGGLGVHQHRCHDQVLQDLLVEDGSAGRGSYRSPQYAIH